MAPPGLVLARLLAFAGLALCQRAGSRDWSPPPLPPPPPFFGTTRAAVHSPRKGVGGTFVGMYNEMSTLLATKKLSDEGCDPQLRNFRVHGRTLHSEIFECTVGPCTQKFLSARSDLCFPPLGRRRGVAFCRDGRGYAPRLRKKRVASFSKSSFFKTHRHES